MPSPLRLKRSLVVSQLWDDLHLSYLSFLACLKHDTKRRPSNWSPLPEHVIIFHCQKVYDRNSTLFPLNLIFFIFLASLDKVSVYWLSKIHMNSKK